MPEGRVPGLSELGPVPPAPPVPPVLVVEDIQVYHGSIEAVKGVSLTVGPGEIVCLIGANGAGKTTTLMSISGVIPPRRGRVKFMGQDVTGFKPERIVGLGVVQVPEGRMIFPQLTVRENLLVGAHLRRDSEVAKDEDMVLSLFPVLGDRLGQPGGALSGGEQQMLALGRALMARPRLLLLDEPSLGLAPLVARRIFEVVKDIAARGTPVLLVEQNATLALETASRGYVIDTGRVALAATSGELMDNPEVRAAYLGLDDNSID